MSAIGPMLTPMCLVANTKDGKLVLQDDAVQVISQIKYPTVVVAIVGVYRTGKSFLMNRLMGRNNGFALGATVESKTKGIWAWYRRHPKQRGCYLLLLDTEGLGDIEKSDDNNDNWIFALSVLLSSTLVYNWQSSLQADAMGKLHYVTQLTDLIKSKSTQNEPEVDKEEFIKFFPNFVWVLRDFTLTLEKDGKPITADEYLRNALALKKGSNKAVKDYNLPRECIQEYFGEKKCFVLKRPVDNDEQFKRLELLDDTDLQPAFLREVHNFCEYIFTSAKPKSVEGKQLNGSMICQLLETFIQTIRSGGIPCIENSVKMMTEIENGKAVQKALANYKDKMAKSLKLPVCSDELSKAHEVCFSDAMKIFVTESISEKDRLHQTELETRLAEEYKNKYEENLNVSKTFCTDLLSRLSRDLDQKLTDGVFAKAGGTKNYQREKEKVISAYENTQGKGIMADNTLQKRLTRWNTSEALIRKADTDLTEAARKAEEYKCACEIENQQKRMAQQQLELKEQVVKDLEESSKKFEEMMKQKFKQDEERFISEREKIIKQKEEEKKKEVEERVKVASEKDNVISKLKAELDEVKRKQTTEVLKEEPAYLRVVRAAASGLAEGVLSYFFESDEE